MTATLAPGTRVVMIGGPWPERRGCTGIVVDGPDIYPFHGVSRHECVVLLDNDPLRVDWDDERPFSGSRHNDEWSCVCSLRDLATETTR